MAVCVYSFSDNFFEHPITIGVCFLFGLGALGLALNIDRLATLGAMAQAILFIGMIIETLCHICNWIFGTSFSILQYV